MDYVLLKSIKKNNFLKEIIDTNKYQHLEDIILLGVNKVYLKKIKGMLDHHSVTESVKLQGYQCVQLGSRNHCESSWFGTNESNSMRMP